jgi:hypothetical protein
MTGQIIESIEVKTLDFGPLPEKDWAVRGRDFNKDKKRHDIFNGPWGPYSALTRGTMPLAHSH